MRSSRRSTRRVCSGLVSSAGSQTAAAAARCSSSLPRRPRLDDSQQRARVRLPEALQAHGGRLAHAPARIGGRCAQHRHRRSAAFGQQPSVAEHAAEGHELARRVGRGAARILPQPLTELPQRPGVGGSLRQLEVAAWAGQPGMLPAGSPPSPARTAAVRHTHSRLPIPSPRSDAGQAGSGLFSQRRVAGSRPKPSSPAHRTPVMIWIGAW